MKDEASPDRRPALYARVSTDAQYEEGYSIDAQVQMLEAYCVTKGLSDPVLYVDGGYSGSNINRPELSRMIGDIREDKISHVIVYKLDRLSRSQKDTLYLIEDVLLPKGVCFVSMNENMDTSTPIGRAMLGIMSAFAQLERETIRERTRMGMQERIRNGLWRGGGKIPFGYDYDAGKGVLVPNADAETVRTVYRLYGEGWSAARIARFTGLKYEHLAEQILKRKTNTGIIPYNGQEYMGKHEPIISKELYDRTMAEMESRSRSGGGNARCLLAGLIVCGVCGAKMRYQKWGKAGYRIYCYSRDKGKPHLHRSESCDNTRIDAAELEQTVLSDLFSMASPAPCTESAGHGKSIAVLIREKSDRLNAKLRNLYHLYGETGDEALSEVISETKKELAEVKKQEEELGSAAEQEKKNLAFREKVMSIRDTWSLMTGTERRNVIRSCVEKIIVTYGKIDLYYRLPAVDKTDGKCYNMDTTR